MNKYESILILSPVVVDEKRAELIAKINELISNNGAEVSIEEWGLKRLAYPVKKHDEGYYVVYSFDANPEAIAEIERVYRITDGVIKYLTVRK